MPDTSFRLSTGASSVHVESTDKANQLTKALQTPENFNQFKADPQGFALKYGITMDPHIAGRLKDTLGTVGSIGDLRQMDIPACTAVAVAEGAAAVSSTKIAAVV